MDTVSERMEGLMYMRTRAGSLDAYSGNTSTKNWASRQLRVRLMDDEIPTAKPGSKRWHESHVHRILRNEAYNGTWWYGKNRHVATEEGRRIHKQPKSMWIEVPFPQMVDADTWERAQALKKQRMSRAKRNTRVFYLLQHLAKCQECGMLLGGRATRQNTVRRNGKVYHYDLEVPRRYYQCYGMKKAPLPLPPTPLHQGGAAGRTDLERG